MLFVYRLNPIVENRRGKKGSRKGKAQGSLRASSLSAYYDQVWMSTSGFIKRNRSESSAQAAYDAALERRRPPPSGTAPPAIAVSRSRSRRTPAGPGSGFVRPPSPTGRNRGQSAAIRTSAVHYEQTAQSIRRIAVPATYVPTVLVPPLPSPNPPSASALPDRLDWEDMPGPLSMLDDGGAAPVRKVARKTQMRRKAAYRVCIDLCTQSLLNHLCRIKQNVSWRVSAKSTLPSSFVMMVDVLLAPPNVHPAHCPHRRTLPSIDAPHAYTLQRCVEAALYLHIAIGHSVACRYVKISFLLLYSLIVATDG
jgi:hypothetical protein